MRRYHFFTNEIYFLTYRTKDFAPFLLDSKVKDIILNRILQCAPNYNDEYFLYSIQDNHLHLTALIEDLKLFSKDLQSIFGGSSYLINKHLNRKGDLWGRHFVLPVSDLENFQRVLGYIMGNPIRHGNVKSFDELYKYPYCNFKYFCDKNGREATENSIMRVLKLKVPEEDEETIRNTLLYLDDYPRQ